MNTMNDYKDNKLRINDFISDTDALFRKEYPDFIVDEEKSKVIQEYDEELILSRKVFATKIHPVNQKMKLDVEIKYVEHVTQMTFYDQEGNVTYDHKFYKPIPIKGQVTQAHSKEQ